MHALLIPVDGDPEVLTHDAWTQESVHAAIGRQSVCAVPLPMRPRNKHWLLVAAGCGATPPNPHARALVGDAGGDLGGPLLVLCMSEHSGLVAGLNQDELILVCTLLLVGECVRGIEAEQDPHQVAAGAGPRSLSTPTEGSTQL